MTTTMLRAASAVGVAHLTAPTTGNAIGLTHLSTAAPTGAGPARASAPSPAGQAVTVRAPAMTSQPAPAMAASSPASTVGSAPVGVDHLSASQALAGAGLSSAAVGLEHVAQVAQPSSDGGAVVAVPVQAPPTPIGVTRGRAAFDWATVFGTAPVGSWTPPLAVAPPVAGDGGGASVNVDTGGGGSAPAPSPFASIPWWGWVLAAGAGVYLLSESR